MEFKGSTLKEKKNSGTAENLEDGDTTNNVEDDPTTLNIIWAATGITMDDDENNNNRQDQIKKHRGIADNSGGITPNGGEEDGHS